MQGELPEEMITAIVCEKMGWTFQEYMDQPTGFIDILILKWNEDTEYKNKQNNVK